MTEDKSPFLAGGKLTRREVIASTRTSSNDEYELTLEWWANYDPGMDASFEKRGQRQIQLASKPGPRPRSTWRRLSLLAKSTESRY